MYTKHWFNENKKIEKILKRILIICILLYPLITSFLGIDLGDTGIHMFNYENIYSHPEQVGFTAYFTNVTGWVWLRLFGKLGIWGLNFLEVILEIIMAGVVYKTFHKYLGDLQTLLGLLIAIMASDTYLNVFNYHQYNVFFLILILCMEFRSIVERKNRYSFIAGIFLALVVFSRMGSITAVVTCFIYIFCYFYNEENIKYLLKQLGFFLSGTSVTVGCFVIFLMVTNQLQYFVNNIFRLSGLASTTGGGYSMDNLWSTFIFGNLDALASGFIYLAATLILLLGMNVLFSLKGINLKKNILNIAFSILIICIAVYQLVYAYEVNKVPNWPQMTTGPSFFIGIMYVVTFLRVFINMYSKKGKTEIVLIGICSVILPLLTIAGSNTGTKHVILAFWIIAPFSVSAICELVFSENILALVNSIIGQYGIKIRRGAVLLCMGIVLCSLGYKFANMVYYTMNFDSVDRSSLKYSIDNDKLKYMKTTKREAESVNGVLYCIENIKQKGDYPLMVFGGSILMYSLTDMESYVQPWLTNSNYSEEKLREDQEKAEQKWRSKPVIVYGRTNNYYGFDEDNYEMLLASEMNNQYNGRKGWLLQFLYDNDYRMEYVNDYYIVFTTGDMTDSENRDYSFYIQNQ